MNRSHQPDQASFRVILPEDIYWKPFPAFPPGARLAIVVGDPAEPGPYVIRVKAPGGTKLMPHKHPEDGVYTVMSGVFYIGLGEAFDGEKVKAYPPGSVIVLPGETWHFHWSKSGEYITQITGDCAWRRLSRFAGRPAAAARPGPLIQLGGQICDGGPRGAAAADAPQRRGLAK